MLLFCTSHSAGEYLRVLGFVGHSIKGKRDAIAEIGNSELMICRLRLVGLSDLCYSAKSFFLALHAGFGFSLDSLDLVLQFLVPSRQVIGYAKVQSNCGY